MGNDTAADSSENSEAKDVNNQLSEPADQYLVSNTAGICIHPRGAQWLGR